MALSYAKKADLIDEIQEQLEKYPIVYLTNFQGLSVSESNDLRGRFIKEGVEYKVCKNTLARIALDRVGGMEELSDFLAGPTAIAFSDDPSKPARVIKNFLDDTDLERPQLKVAYIEGALYEGHEALEALTKLKSREELIGDIVGLLLSPAQNIVGGLTGVGQTLAGAIKAIADKDEDA